MANSNQSDNQLIVTAMVIGSRPIGDYDRRIVLLTRECGRISAFARGARRQSSPLLAATDLFAFGTFRLYEGRDSRSVQEAQISQYFEWFRTHMEESLYASYFCEVMNWCTRENNDESQLLLLLYQSFRALVSREFSNVLVRSIFEIKTVVLEGEFQKPGPDAGLQEAVRYAVDFIERTPIAHLYSFRLSEGAERQLSSFASAVINRYCHHDFSSLKILQTLKQGPENTV